MSHHSLIWRLARREVISRYRGSAIGVLWAFLHPFIMLTVYALVFHEVFGSRFETSVGGPVDFSMQLFAGLIVFSFLSESFHRAPYLILNNVTYVKRVVFPLEILPWTSLCAAVFHAIASVAVLVLLYGFAYGHIPWTVVCFPLVLVPLALGTMGFSWILASIGVFVRDVGQAIGPATTVLLFLSPVFYPVSAVPEHYRWVLYFNPLTFLVQQSQDILIWGRLPNWAGLAIYALGGYLLAWIGLMWFQRTRKAFADVV